MIAVLEQLGYVLEERLPPEEKLEQRDLSVFGYLQIADRLPSNNIIALDLDEFNQLIADVVRNQYGVFARSLRPRPISFERTARALAHIVVRDPTGVLRGPAEPEQYKPSTSALSAASSIFPEGFQGCGRLLQELSLGTSRIDETSSDKCCKSTTSPRDADTSSQARPRRPYLSMRHWRLLNLSRRLQRLQAIKLEAAEQPDDSELVEMSEQELGGTFGDTTGFDPLNLDVLHHLPPIQTPTIGSASGRTKETNSETGEEEICAT